MDIGGTSLSSDAVYFIAEAGVNHNGDLDLARELIDAAVTAGADAVKFQTFSADRLVTATAQKANYQTQTTNEGQSQREMLEQYELTRPQHEELRNHCRDHEIDFLSTPFDVESADLLHNLDVPVIKIGSGELTNKPLLEHVATNGKPMIVSTGMGTLEEVKDAKRWIRRANPDVDLAFLHCTSMYPTEMSDVNLRAMIRMSEELTVPVGYSDHTAAETTPGFAVAAGARIVEKHLTLDRSMEGPDHEASLEPTELGRAISIARDAVKARGTAIKRPVGNEKENRKVVRKSVHAARNITAGEYFERSDLVVKRPADGIPSADLDTVVGSRATRSLVADDPITIECFDSTE